MTTPVGHPAQIVSWLGGQVAVRVEVDLGPGEGVGGVWDESLWDEGVWGEESPTWTDISEWVLEIQIDYGFQRWGERSSAGTCSVLVDNTLGYFTPDGTAEAPFFRPYRLGRRLRVVAIPDPTDPDTVVPQFTGRIDSSNDLFDQGGFEVTATIACTDFMGSWARSQPAPSAATGVQRSDLRVAAALDKFGWSATDRDLQVGTHDLLSSTLAETTLEEAQLAADAEGGAFFSSKDGLATFKNRDWLISDARSITIQGYVGYEDAPTGEQAAHAVDVQTSNELARVANDVQFTREGGSLQQVQDAASQVLTNGPITYAKTGLQNDSDVDVLTLAERYLEAFKDPRIRLDSVTIVGVEDPGNDDLNRLLWDTELGDRLSVLVSPPWGWEIEREVHVMGISHTITGSEWSATFRLDDAQILEFTYWILGDGEFGVLGETTRLL